MQLQDKENSSENYSCFRCGSSATIKKGKVFNSFKTTWRQQFQCKKCGLKFLVGKSQLADSYEPEAFKYQSQPLPAVNWSAYNQGQINEKLMLFDLASELLDFVEMQDIQATGRPSQNIKEILFCMILKTYSKLSSRRLISDLELAKQHEFISKVPCYSTVMLYFNDQRLTKVLHELIELSALPLKPIEQDFAVDSSGFSLSKFGRWFDHKFNQESEKRIYRKAHCMVGVKTNAVVSVQITDGFDADSPQLKPLVHKAALNFKIRGVSADKAYSSRDNLEAIEEVGALPFIAFKKNAIHKGMGKSRIWHRMLSYFQQEPQAFGEHYHKRSNVETSFFMIKQKFDDCLMTKNYQANVNEILCKILCHNICCLINAYFEFGLNISFQTKAYESQKISIKA